MTHHLKVTPRHWPDYKSGNKTNSFRKCDRPYSVGDTVVYQLWENDRFIANELVVKKITHVLHDYDFKELTEGYCIISHKDV